MAFLLDPLPTNRSPSELGSEPAYLIFSLLPTCKVLVETSCPKPRARKYAMTPGQFPAGCSIQVKSCDWTHPSASEHMSWRRRHEDPASRSKNGRSADGTSSDSSSGCLLDMIAATWWTCTMQPS